MTGEERLVEQGLELFMWQPGFDQQPIEAAALAEAAESAWRATGDPHWAAASLAVGRWLIGDNDVAAVLYDPETGACFDGLMRNGVNRNQGAESTIAGLAGLQARTRVEEGQLSRPSSPPCRAEATR